MKANLKEVCMSIFQGGLKAVDPREAVEKVLISDQQQCDGRKDTH